MPDLRSDTDSTDSVLVDPVMQAAQAALAEVLLSPSSDLLVVIQRQVPTADTSQVFRIAATAKDLIADRIGGLRRDTGDEVSPTRVERYSFAWEVLRQVRVQLRRLKKGALPKSTTVMDAVPVVAAALGTTPTEHVLQAIFKLLDLGADARHLHQYWAFLKPSWAELRSDPQPGEFRRVLRWILLSRKEKYADVSETGELIVHFQFLVKNLLSDLHKIIPSAPVESVSLKSQAESVINGWLDYSAITELIAIGGEDGTEVEASDTRTEFIRAFRTFNDLKERLVPVEGASEGSEDKRVSELETLVRQYAAENKVLEDALEALRKTPGSADPTPGPEVPETAGSGLRDLLRAVDSKYPLDLLNAIQLGEESPLTFKSFVGHLFYALRKRGLTVYPERDTVVVTYEESGLYECVGFEVAPGQSVTAAVVARGWGLRAKSRVLPVRRAIVKPAIEQ